MRLGVVWGVGALLLVAVGTHTGCKRSDTPAPAGGPAGSPSAPAPADGGTSVAAQTPNAARAAAPEPGFRHLAELGQMRALDFEPLKKKADRYATVLLQYDKAVLSEAERQMLPHLIEAAVVMDHLFWRQASADGLEVWQKLQGLKDSYGQALRRYVRINAGRFDRLDNHEPFIGTGSKPLGATYYPRDLRKEEFEAWVKAHPADEKAFADPYTVIRREGPTGLKAVPYSVEYAEPLQQAAAKLRAAAALSQNESLRKFLESRAAAFLSNDYYASECDWMDVEGSALEVTVGPYEVYEDRLLGYKAAFEAFITLNDPQATAELDRLVALIGDMEQNLPLADEHKNLKRGGATPVRVADLVYSSGDTRAGVQTLAFNLPNDERVREAKGSKKVLLRNVSDAKYEKILVPIAQRVLADDQLPLVSKQAYFTHSLTHEVSHGLGPGTLALPDGTSTTVSKALKELYPAIEEAKADVLGDYNMSFAIRRGAYPDTLGPQTAVTSLAGVFRSVRFGTEEAHGKGNLLIFNYLLDRGAYVYDAAAKRFRVDLTKIEGALTDLAREILTIQAKGDYAGARALLDKYGSMRPEMKALIDSFQDIPVDIEPIYPVEQEQFGGNTGK